MEQSPVSLSSGDQANPTLYRSAHGDLSPSAVALAMVSGDSFLVASPALPRPRPVLAPSVRPDRRRVAGGGRGRSRQGRFSPYPAPGVKLDLLRSVLQQRLLALGGGAPARVPA